VIKAEIPCTWYDQGYDLLFIFLPTRCFLTIKSRSDFFAGFRRLLVATGEVSCVVWERLRLYRDCWTCPYPLWYGLSCLVCHGDNHWLLGVVNGNCCNMIRVDILIPKRVTQSHARSSNIHLIAPNHQFLFLVWSLNWKCHNHLFSNKRWVLQHFIGRITSPKQ
jgi:hypothetical protein